MAKTFRTELDPVVEAGYEARFMVLGGFAQSPCVDSDVQLILTMPGASPELRGIMAAAYLRGFAERAA